MHSLYVIREFPFFFFKYKKKEFFPSILSKHFREGFEVSADKEKHVKVRRLVLMIQKGKKNKRSRLELRDDRTDNRTDKK